MEKHDVIEVLVILFVLAFAVVVVEERWLRVAVAVVPALLLAQRSLAASKVEAPTAPVGAADRRMDGATRTAVDQLLWQVREFYLTCHLMGSGKMTSDEAVEKTAKLEKELNKILASVTEGARVRAGRTSSARVGA